MSVYYADDQVTLHLGDALEVAREQPDGAADCIVTSPPYFGLRDYGIDGQYGLESSPAEYVETMRALFADTHNVAEGAGAAALAGLLTQRERWLGKRVGIALTGGNVDTAVFARVLAGG